MPIFGVDGKIKYVFWCKGGTTEKMDADEEKTGISSVGSFMCRLNEGSKHQDESLLCEDDSAVWYSRGQIYESEVVGACGKYPEFGAERNFKLRNMRLTILLSNIVIGENKGFSKFTLRVNVKPDKNATHRYAEQPGYLDPRGLNGDCTTIRKGVEPRMCRDWVHKDRLGSWIECEKLRPHY